ncbi:p21-activated protein kinase-interacting protein 1-like [Pecten maximus]|uniref:p21-activated protein kinase-interacting protein 1-like n=1 Tax=Pecten maximus TaxID=6579 RepID=UPI0014582845|nr:p21-activated protein kinase-interacting protein 1-like [Pecten maximus]
MEELIMEVVVGTYDEVLLGYKIIRVAEAYQFDQSFTDHSHMGCVKTLSISKKGILASGGTDETIRLINLKKRTELGSLVQHSGTVTCLKFHQGSHMFSTSEDGTIGMWKYFTWECLKTLRGHTSAVNYISIHPSGRLALSVGRDKTLRTWNLITGRSAYTTNIKQEASQVVWSPSGNHYAVVFFTRIDIYNTQTAEVISTVKTTHRVNDLAFISKTVLVYGGEGGQVYFYNIVNKTTVHNLDTQTNRIRAMTVVPAPPEECEESIENSHWLFTASSDGHIKIFKVQCDEDEVHTALVVSHNTTFRVTCMAVSVFKSKSKEGTKKDSQHVNVKKIKGESQEVVTDTKTEKSQKEASKGTSRDKSQVADKKLKKVGKVSRKRKTETESQDSGVNVSHEVRSENESTKTKKVKFSETVTSEKTTKKLKKIKQKKEVAKSKCHVTFPDGKQKKKKMKS